MSPVRGLLIITNQLWVREKWARSDKPRNICVDTNTSDFWERNRNQGQTSLIIDVFIIMHHTYGKGPEKQHKCWGCMRKRRQRSVIVMENIIYIWSLGQPQLSKEVTPVILRTRDTTQVQWHPLSDLYQWDRHPTSRVAHRVAKASKVLTPIKSTSVASGQEQGELSQIQLVSLGAATASREGDTRINPIEASVNFSLISCWPLSLVTQSVREG